MTVHPLAGQEAPRRLLVNVPRLVSDYYAMQPDPHSRSQRVTFGTSGHRGSSTDGSFNEAHILAIAQSICEYRTTNAITGPLFLGMDTHALSEPAFITALEVFAANEVNAVIQAGAGIYADAGHFTRDPHSQPWPRRWIGRRRCDYAIAQPARRWRFQI